MVITMRPCRNSQSVKNMTSLSSLGNMKGVSVGRELFTLLAEETDNGDEITLYTSHLSTTDNIVVEESKQWKSTVHIKTDSHCFNS